MGSRDGPWSTCRAKQCTWGWGVHGQGMCRSLEELWFGDLGFLTAHGELFASIHKHCQWWDPPPVQRLVVTSLEHPEFSGCYEALPSGSQWPCLRGGGKILDFSEFFPLFRLFDGMMLFNPSIQLEDFTKWQVYIYVCKYVKLPLFRVISYEVLYGWTKQKLWIKCWEWFKSLTVWVDNKSTHH